MYAKIYKIFFSISPILTEPLQVDGYTEAIGQDLGVIGEADTFDPESYKPVLKGKAFPGYVGFTYKKLGIDGLNFYSRLKELPTGRLSVSILSRHSTIRGHLLNLINLKHVSFVQKVF